MVHNDGVSSAWAITGRGAGMTEVRGPVPGRWMRRGAGLVVVVWLLGMLLTATPAGAAAARLHAGDRLFADDFLTSANGAISLVVQADGDVVLEAPDGTPRWSAGTGGHPGATLVMQPDGNLVVRAASGETLWQSGTVGTGAYLQVYDDGRFDVVAVGGQPVWTSGTSYHPARLGLRDALGVDQRLQSPDGGYELLLAEDGNLVLSDAAGPAWESETGGSGGERLAVAPDGDLVLTAADGSIVWRSNTAGSGVVSLRLEDDGRLVLADLTGAARWHTPAHPTLAPSSAEVVATSCADVDGPVPRESTVVASGFRVHPCLAGAVDQLVADALVDGVELGGGGWRSAEAQIELRRVNCGESEVDVWEKAASECFPATANPGRSRHERGLAIDFTQDGRILTADSPGFAWLVAHAEQYGLENLPSEPWHWSVDGG
ncbi:D-alanyl-D-alanine carboxypeptidase family protein [Cellulomonas sp. P22]|uniref:D-alanyl-D-alanine carboxypeptidase family protein n=1 Tax=Cellulomonas sp. P22 TaxID=3373189 RepID=UPI003788A865